MRKAGTTVTRSAERNPFARAEPNSPIAAHNPDPCAWPRTAAGHRRAQLPAQYVVGFRCSPRSAFNRGLGAAALVLAAVVVFEPALAAGLYHARELVGILGQVSRVDRSAGVRQADPGGNNGTVSGLSSENSFTATPWAAKYSIACAGRFLAMPQALGRMAAPCRRPRCARRIPGLSPGGELTRRWLALPGCPVKSQRVLCIGRAQEKARYRPGGQINRFVKIDGG